MAMTLRLSSDDERLLGELAEAEGISRQALTIRAIHEMAERRGHSAAVSQASKRARDRYAKLLERFGE